MATTAINYNPAYTAIAVAYPQGRRIGDDVFPRVDVVTEQFKWTRYALTDRFHAPDTRVGRKSAPNVLDFGGTEVNDSVNDEGLDAHVPNKDIKAWQNAMRENRRATTMVDPVSRHIELIMDAVLNRREVRCATLATTLANYGVNNRVTLAGTGQWSDFVNSDPTLAVLTAMDGMFVRPTHAWCGRDVATRLTMHPKLVKALYGDNTDSGVVSLDAIARLWGLQGIYVGDARVNTAAPGLTPSIQRCWGKDFGLFYKPDIAMAEGQVQFGFTAQYDERVAGTYDDPKVGLRGGVTARAGESVKEIITANDLGYLFKNAVA